MGMLVRYVGLVAAVLLTVNVVPGIVITGGWETAFLVALVWSVISLVIKPVLHILALPITIITFGIFALVLNALLFLSMAWIVPGFAVLGFWPALWGSIVLSIFSWLINKLF